MKKKTIWLILSCFLVLSLLFASCAPAVTGEEEVAPPEKEEVVTEEEEAAPTEEEVVIEEEAVTEQETPAPEEIPATTPTPAPTPTPTPTPKSTPVLVSGDWVQVMSGGFDDRMNSSISEFKVFKGQFYAATTRLETTSLDPPKRVPYSGAAQLWHSEDGQTWSRITSFYPPPPESCKGIYSMETSGQDEEFLYVGFSSGVGVGPLYRSADGKNFQQINGSESGFDVTGATGGLSLAVKETRGKKYLYVGGFNSPGRVWRILYDATSGWEKVLDSASVDATVIGVTYIYVWEDTLYVGTHSGKGCKLFQSTSGDPGTWKKNAGVGNGWGVPLNHDIAAMVEFNKFLYATTINVKTGGQIWRTLDGQQWQQVVNDGLGNPKNQEPHRFAVAQGKLWVTFFSEAPSQVWCSDDGLQFVQSNLDGFGDPGITGGYPRIIEFGGTMYWGGSKPKAGAQIWRIGN